MISIVISTFDRSPNPNYLFQTLESLHRAGVLDSPLLTGLYLVDSGSASSWPPVENSIFLHPKVWCVQAEQRRSAKWNCAAALRVGANSGATWVVHLEDDVLVCADFVGSLTRWLESHGADDRLNVFSGDNPGFAQKISPVWQYPVEMFWGMQCFAVRPNVALNIADWFETHGLPEHNAHDIELHRWAEFHGIKSFAASAPSFVQHIGNVTSIANNPNGGHLVSFPSWPGPEWKYETPKRRLLWVGDAACPSGFAKATHAILETLRQTYDITVLAINYRGDPHTYPYDIFAAAPGGDMFGIGRLAWMCDYVKPDVIVLQNDGWNLPAYVAQIRQFKEFNSIKLVAAVAVDGKNFQKEWLNGLDSVIFWTQFALDEARAAGYEGPASVIPLGVDLSIYRKIPQADARSKRGLIGAEKAFIVGNVNRNQPRKRWDITIKAFAAWVKQYDVQDAFLFLHTAPTGDTGVNVHQLASYYGVLDRLILVQPPVFYGIPEEDMALTYNCFDVLMSTTQGEGFGLTTIEAMACSVPVIVPDFSALGDWARDGAVLVSCPTTCIGPPYVNVIGGVPDETELVDALQALYVSREYREKMAREARAVATRAEYDWKFIGREYARVLKELFPSETA